MGHRLLVEDVVVLLLLLLTRGQRRRRQGGRVDVLLGVDHDYRLMLFPFSFRGYWVSMLHVAQEDIMIVGNQ
jgi:hypothetical protein